MDPTPFTSKKITDIIKLLIVCDIILLLIYWLDAALGRPSVTLNLLFDLDLEANIPTWYSSTQLFAIGLSFWFIARFAWQGDIKVEHLLLILAAAFVYFSLDECAGIHEKITGTLRRFDMLLHFKGSHGIWIPLYLSAGAVFCAVFFRQGLALYHAYPREVWLFIAGAGIFLFGTVVMEVLGYEFSPGHVKNLFYFVENGVEEFSEMLGESIMLWGALCVLKK